MKKSNIDVKDKIKFKRVWEILITFISQVNIDFMLLCAFIFIIFNLQTDITVRTMK